MDTFFSDLVIALFGNGNAALLFAGALLLLGAALIVTTNWREHQPMVSDLTRLVNLFTGVRGDRRQAQATFFQDFDEVDQAFSSHAVESPELSAGWDRFKNTLIPTQDGRYLATARSSDAFDRLDGSAQSLDWWANIMVAVGLVITFLGITAALSEVARAVSSPGQGTDVQGAMVGLLAIAATKFWSSIAGVLASVVLRLVARRRRGSIHRLESALFNGLDRCVDFAGSEAIALRQLDLLERIERAVADPSGEPAPRARPA